MEPEVHKKPIRFYEIDLLRFLAALSVVFYHYTYRGYQEGHMSPVAYPELASFTKYGRMGVALFFIISGYVVLLSAHGKTPRQFFLSRVTRLYPAFWAATIFTFTLLRLTGPHPTHPGYDIWGWHFLVNMTMMYGFTGTPQVDSAYWSLPVEITFYFLIAIVIGWKLYKALPWLLALWLIYTAVVGPAAANTPFSILFFPNNSPYFVAGMVFYMLQNKWFASWKLYALLAASFPLALRSVHLDIVTSIQVFKDPNYSFTLAAIVTACFYIVFFLIINRIINLEKQRWLAWLGALTYPLYLVHSTVGYLILEKVGDSINKYLLLAGIVTLALLLAYLIHKLVEKPLHKPLGNATNRLLQFLGT